MGAVGAGCYAGAVVCEFAFAGFGGCGGADLVDDSSEVVWAHAAHVGGWSLDTGHGVDLFDDVEEFFIGRAE
jgi:hypothetical protein